VWLWAVSSGGRDWGVGFATGRRGRTQQRTPSFYQRIARHAPSVSNHCVLTMKGIVLPSFIWFKMGGWIVVHGEGVGLLLREVDFGGASEFTKPHM